MKRVTAEDSFQPQPAPSKRPIALDRFIRVAGAGRSEATLRKHQMRQRELVPTNQPQGHGLRPPARVHVSRSGPRHRPIRHAILQSGRYRRRVAPAPPRRRREARPAGRVSGSPAPGAVNDCGPPRTLRIGERRSPSARGPASLDATPSRGGAGAPGARFPNTVRDRPRAATAREAGTARPSAAPVFRRQLHREALATLLAPARERCASPLVLHARAESVLVDAAPVARAVRRLPHVTLT